MGPLLASLYPDAVKVATAIALKVSKAMTAENKAAADQFKAQVAADALTTQDLRQTLENLYGDAYLAGAHAAQEQGASVLTADMAQVLATTNWSAWKPGYQLAADKVSGTGLSDLLDQADITIKGITETNLTRLGNALAQGLAAGDSVETIARNIADLTTSASDTQAQTIAATEVARAQIAGTLDNFAEAGIEQYNWLAESDACPECEDMADSNPHDMGDDTPPLHPNCRCAITAVITTGSSTTDDSEESST